MSFPDSQFFTLKKTLLPCNSHHITPNDPTKINHFVQYAYTAAQLPAHKMSFSHGRFQTIIQLHVQ